MKQFLHWMWASTCLAVSFNFFVTDGSAQSVSPEGKEGSYWVYIGTYTGAKSKGIYLYRLNRADGKLDSLGLAAELTHPTFLAVHPNQRFLYAVNEIGQYDGKRSGSVSAYAIAPKTGKLTFLNRQPSGGGGPCHLVVDNTGQQLLVANYGGGSTAMLPIQQDGKLGEQSAFFQHKGSSVNRQRQEGPHAHGIALDAANRFALVADLGLDQVLVYRLDASKGTLTPNEEPWAKVKAGAGPRHVAFHPQRPLVYGINELDSTLTVFEFQPERGVLREVQTISTLPASFTGNNSTAEVAVHPSGKFLYGSNRGHHSIAVFAIDSETGSLTLLEHQSTQGKTPRNFGIDPTGTYLLAANQDTHNIVVFRIEKDGRLKPTGQQVEVGAPVCVTFVRTE